MRHRQAGIGMIEALIALVIFSVGLLGIAAVYVQTAPAPAQNMDADSVQMAADAFMSVLFTDSTALPVNISNASSASAMPDAPLQNWFSQFQQVIPGLSVSVSSGPDGSNNACSSQSCAITLTLSWSQMGSTRSQVFHGQVGLR